jgi:general secretion pathway protein G
MTAAFTPSPRHRITRAMPPAFTLIEILVVVAVITILAGITIGTLGGVNEKASRDRAKAEVAAISSALEAYRAEFGSYPTPLNSSNVPHTNIAGYLPAEKIQATNGTLMDPYGQPYIYLLPGGAIPTRNRVGFDLYSLGKDPAKTNAWIGNW